MRAISFLCWVFLFAQAAFAQSPARTGKDYAVFFVAAKFDHGWTSLPYSLSEVNDLAAELRDQYGFQVQVVADARRADIIRVLGEYKKKAYGANDQLLLYFTMHGYHDAGSDKGYLIPKDGLYDDPTYDSWLSHSQLAEITASMPCRRVLVSLDACYSGIFGGNKEKPGAAAWESGNDCQTKVAAAFQGTAKTRKYAAAGGDERVPKKSEFAVQWLRALRTSAGEDGLLSFMELVTTLDQFKEPRPAWGDFDRSTTGDFVFVRKDGCAAAPAPAGNSPSDQDKVFWRQTQAGNTVEAYRKYLRDCSLCLYTEEAEVAIVRGKPAALPEKEPAAQTKKVAETRPDDGLVFVQGGTFTMGCTAEQGNDCSDDEKPAHQVMLSDFYIGKYEVTQALWRSVMGSNPLNLNFEGCDQCPVVSVSWDEVQEFLTKLNAQSGRQYRLPTEAEWEYAARGGKSSKGYKNAGSNKLDEVAWYSSNSGSKIHTVGGKKANELGLFDMSGNVWEWCSDWKGPYSSSSPTDPAGATSGSDRVYRGGSCGSEPQYERVANCGGDEPTNRFSDLGFRLARTF
ncbi:MAG: SUMF1/EgtB/PvdO family nonheme iron enzyme [Saprospiraceae bacterium]